MSGSGDATVPGTDAAGDGVEVPGLGARLGRYELKSMIGAGGMGVVFAAHDPQLDRTVAVKVLHVSMGKGSTDGELRLQREGQTMARLSHPNVIRVYDVGSAQGSLFVAMEYVDGGTLQQWLSRAARSAAEILAAFVQAGRGLAAAHDAGLIHRDFKPSNVLVGADGRVLVTDFGLARSSDAAADPDGAVEGTPGYMAPEQRTGGALDARADQFSFCVSLAKALDGKRVPARVRAALDRGQRAAADERFASMHELLAALAPPAGKRTVWIALGGGALVAGAIAAWVLVGSDRPAADPCASLDDRFAGVWDADTARAVEAAFTATGMPYARAAFRATSRQLDARRAAWLAMRHDSCAATRIRHEQPDAIMDARATCLERRLEDLSAFVGELRRADAATVRGADQQAATIGDVTACGDVEALARRMPLPDDPARRTEIGAISRDLAEVRARLAAGHYRELADPATALVTRARAADHPPILADALTLAADVYEKVGRAREAEPLLDEAVLVAEAGGDDRQRLDAETRLVRIVGYLLERDEDARRHADRATALLTRIGSDPRRAAQLAAYRATSDWWNGRYADARVRADEAVQILTALDPDGSVLAKALHLRAIVEQEMGDLEASVASAVKAREVGIRALGPDHPIIGDYLEAEGGSLRLLGRYDEADVALQRGLALLVSGFGPDSNEAANAYTNLAILDMDREHFDAAIASLRRVIEINTKVLGPDHSRIADNLELLGGALSKGGHPAEAVDALERAIAIHAARLGPDAPPTASSHRGLGKHYLRTGEPAKARAEFLESVRALTASQGADSPMLGKSFALLGDAELALHHGPAAVDAYTHALARIGTDAEDAGFRAEVEASLAKAQTPPEPR
jgi:tetratricopeptide (TPR) repeat protein